jgi:hypothetical protein
LEEPREVRMEAGFPCGEMKLQIRAVFAICKWIGGNRGKRGIRRILLARGIGRRRVYSQATLE